mmetsp:Transcript_88757/g.153687  ORF Transcript_88757/g.153687 Transcript_88757/m.153687 type:complete len:176 (-) Transcript_88757:95-622(-)
MASLANSNEGPTSGPTWRSVAKQIAAGKALDLPEPLEGIVHPMTFQERPSTPETVDDCFQRFAPERMEAPVPEQPQLERLNTPATARLVRGGGILGSAHLMGDESPRAVPGLSASLDFSVSDHLPMLDLNRSITDILGPATPARRVMTWDDEDLSSNDEDLPEDFWKSPEEQIRT